MSRLAIPALALLACVLALVMAWELRDDTGSLPPREDPAPAAAASAGVAGPAAAGREPEDHVAEWAETALARPLFRPGRRPPTETGTATAGAAQSALPRLTGVMVGPFGKRAIFAGAAGGKPVVVGEGGQIAGFTLQSIETGQVVVAGPDGQVVVRPSFDKSAPPPSPPAPPTPGAPPARAAPPAPPAQPRTGGAALGGEAPFRLVGIPALAGRSAP